MGLPMMKITPQIAAMRIRENKWDALDRALRDLFLDLAHDVSMPLLFDAAQAALTARMGMLDACSNERITLIRKVKILKETLDKMDCAGQLEHADRRDKRKEVTK